MSTDEPIATPAPAPDPAPAAATPAAEPVRQIVTVTPEVQDALRTLMQAELAPEVDKYLGDKVMVEIEAAVARELDARIADLKADILAHLTPMIAAVTGGAIVTAAAAAAPAPQTAAPAIALKAEDPVKVWQDAEHKTFLEGAVVAVHDGAHAFDVKLPDGTVTKVGADGLEYDDRR